MACAQYEPPRGKRKKKPAPNSMPGAQLQGNYHQAPLHLCTNNLAAAAIDTVHAERHRLTPVSSIASRP